MNREGKRPEDTRPGEDVTESLLNEMCRTAPAGSHTALTSMLKITSAGARVAAAADGQLIEYVSNPLLYSRRLEWRFGLRDRKTLWRLLLGGHLRVVRLDGPMINFAEGLAKVAQPGFAASYHYRIERKVKS